MLHMKNQTNYKDKQKSVFCMKNIDLTGEYNVKVISS